MMKMMQIPSSRQIQPPTSSSSAARPLQQQLLQSVPGKARGSELLLLQEPAQLARPSSSRMMMLVWKVTLRQLMQQQL
jgi:hypothetical protein